MSFFKTTVSNETVGDINERARAALERKAEENMPLQYAMKQDKGLVHRMLADYIDTQVGASSDLIKSHLAATKNDVETDAVQMKELLEEHTNFTMQAIRAAAHEAIRAFVPGYRPPQASLQKTNIPGR